ncbi:unnamed protein product [Rotaria magnacalcarata]|nr:unnamed protein product [Rotaria magnacalcarata]CAF1589654.1 unnamed protein product [Rotaria magnacalcarata]CAF1925697.1 unnamed protein product [Rotaria magnacalcarata]CAF2035053.1 unnamed protein product [Rotaria magnacalcarata]CAF3862012.1 unnamed protein product [Rotaria magnacalcarata]
MIVGSLTAPAFDKPTNLGIIPINMCPMPMCMQIQQPCDNIQISYITMNGKKCPMCPYCARPTVEQP